MNDIALLFELNLVETLAFGLDTVLATSSDEVLRNQAAEWKAAIPDEEDKNLKIALLKSYMERVGKLMLASTDSSLPAKIMGMASGMMQMRPGEPATQPHNESQFDLQRYTDMQKRNG